MKDGLLHALHQLCSRGVAERADGAEHLPAIARAIERAGPPAGIAPQSRPTVEQHLADALASAERCGDAGLARAIGAAAGRLAWQDTRHDYGAHPEFAPFVANFAYAPILGPDIYGPMNLFPSREVFFGISLQAPRIHYPAHGHKAIEIYYVIAGAADWRRGAEDWTTRPPGSFILHDPEMPHAMQTHDEALLTFFAWVSDLDCRIWLGEAP